MSITLRKKPLQDGRQSLYLDMYEEGKRKKEYLKLYLVKRPKDELEKQHNKETLKLAESIRSQRELQANSQEHGFDSPVKKKINFLDYFEQFAQTYPKKDKRLVTACLSKFKAFAGKNYLKPAEVTEQLCYSFKEYLEGQLKGESPANYFSKFKRMVKQAVREKILPSNPAEEVRSSRTSGVKKDILSVAEIQALASAHCGNGEVKRAFLFSCVSGLRFCDLVALQWKHINRGVLQINQAKTERPVIINLNATALKLLGEPGESEQHVFTLPSHTGCSKVLRYWAKRAGVQKHVTFHVGRHSFATNLLIHQTDVKTVSSLLGHTSLHNTQKYVRVVDALKTEAVNRLPEINLDPATDS